MNTAFRQCRILKTDIQETTLALACHAIVDKALSQRACADSNLASHQVAANMADTISEFLVSTPPKADGLPSGGGFVCLANVHMLMEAYDSKEFNELLSRAFMVLADGKPLAVGQSLLGFSHGEQIRGYRLFQALIAMAAEQGLRVGFYGGQDDTVLRTIITAITAVHPKLQVCYQYAPPYRPLTAGEDFKQQQRIADARLDLLFVGLGCPKQELWMDQHPNITAVQIGVGAVFDFVAGHKSQAPVWMQDWGLEWLFRWWQEPKRLTGRYLRHNPRFIFYFISQWFQHKMGKSTR
jgi:N-acetylglucosaminyldiphosphoundecaprenol N-acetyl-beta-D-mannosaminyltransferase